MNSEVIRVSNPPALRRDRPYGLEVTKWTSIKASPISAFHRSVPPNLGTMTGSGLGGDRPGAEIGQMPEPSRRGRRRFGLDRPSLPRRWWRAALLQLGPKIGVIGSTGKGHRGILGLDHSKPRSLPCEPTSLLQGNMFQNAVFRACSRRNLLMYASWVSAGP